MTKYEAISDLENGLEKNCADDITEVLCNLADGTCDYVELIPFLEKIAAKDRFYYFDDNGAGGFPRQSGEPHSFRKWALEAIENIKENQRFEADSQIANQLKSLDNQTIKTTLEDLVNSNCKDEKLIPILEKIARKNNYLSYSYIGGYDPSPQQFGELANNIVRKIRDNIEKEKLKN